MTKIGLRPWLVRAALALAAVVGTGGAQAVVYTGSWDPLYGTAPFQNLGWGAEAVFDVPSACLAQADATYITSSGPCGGFAFLSASLSFYNALDPAATVLETLAIGNVANVEVRGVAIQGGKVSGIGTGYFAAVVPTASGAAASIDGAGAYSFSLLLLGTEEAQLIFASPVSASPGCADNVVRGTFCGKSQFSATGSFQVASIPEPASVATLAMGLVALAVFVGKRRRRVAAPRG